MWNIGCFWYYILIFLLTQINECYIFVNIVLILIKKWYVLLRVFASHIKENQRGTVKLGSC